MPPRPCRCGYWFSSYRLGTFNALPPLPQQVAGGEIPQQLQSLPAPSWWGLIITRPGGGGYFYPPRISGTTGQIYKIQTSFDSPLKTLEGKVNLLTSGSLMTSQVRSKVKCFNVHGCSIECVITSSKTHFIETHRQSVSCLYALPFAVGHRPLCVVYRGDGRAAH